MKRTVGIWISGLLASFLLGHSAGGILGANLSYLLKLDSALGLGAVLAFTCARLWVRETLNKGKFRRRLAAAAE